jgi:hypothetical protein
MEVVKNLFHGNILKKVLSYETRFIENVIQQSLHTVTVMEYNDMT